MIKYLYWNKTILPENFYEASSEKKNKNKNKNQILPEIIFDNTHFEINI